MFNKRLLIHSVTVLLFVFSITAIFVSLKQAINLRQPIKPEQTKNVTAPVEQSRKDKCYQENPNNKVSGRVSFTVKVGTTNKQVYEIAHQVTGSSYVQPSSGRISDIDNPNIERTYSVAVPKGAETEAVANLLVYPEVSTAEWLNAGCDRL